MYEWMGKKLDNAHAGKDAVMWVLLYIGDGDVNWCDPSDFFPNLERFIPFKPIIPQLLISPRGKSKGNKLIAERWSLQACDNSKN